MKIGANIFLPAGTEIDDGLHEDGDFLTVLTDREVIVAGTPVGDAIPVIFEGRTYFYHQPADKLTKRPRSRKIQE